MKAFSLVRALAVAASLLFTAGCASEKLIYDSKRPEVAFSSDGGLLWRGRFVAPEELPELLRDADVNPQSQIDIRVPGDFSNPKIARRVLFILRRAGYTRAVLVTEKHASSKASSPPPEQKSMVMPTQRRIRYK